VNIITRENVDDFLLKKPEFSSVSLQLLTASILNGDETQVDKFFEDVYNTFVESELITPEFFRGFSIEVLSILIHLLRINDLDEQTLLSDFESLYKNLFNQKTPRKTLEWLCRISKDVIRTIMFEKRAESKIDRIIRYVNRNYSEQLSLKVLSCQFNLSSTYLGRLLHDAIGMSFTTYLNDLRLRKAEELLRFKTLKACQVAKRVGYSNVSYFYTLFKKYKGFYPSQLRIRT
jgi:two-component system response regulator YesN